MSAPQHMHTRKQMHTQMPRVAKVAPTKQQELLRLVSALSGACRADGNVLKDAQLVDLLESQAKAILQSRREKKQSFKQQQQWRTSANSTATATAAADAPTISPQRSKLIKKLADASDKSGGVSKRRKLSFETEPQQQQRAGSPRKAAMPPVRAFGKPAAAMDDGCGVNFVGDKDPAVAMDKLEAFTSAARSSSLSVFRAGVVDHMFQRSGGVSPQPFYKARAAFKSLDEASVSGSGSMSAVGGVDLSASMASTVASTSAGYYDDLYDDLSESRYRRGAHSPGVESRGRHTPLSELTQSVDSIDWSPSDDEDDELLAHATHRAVLSSASMSPALLGGGFDGREMVFSGDAETETEEVSCATASSTEAVMQVLYDILRQDAKYKWLVDSANQARVAKLVALHQREQQQGLDGNEDAKAVTQNQNLTQTQNQNQELRAQVEALVLENARLVEANELSACDIEAQQQRVHELLVKLQSATAAVAAAKAEVEAQTANATKTAAAVTAAPVLATAPRSDAETRLAATQQQLLAQESMRREAEAAFAAQLRAKSESVAALQQDVAAKDGEVARLMAQVAAISAAFVAKSQACSSADNDADGSSTTMTTSTTWSSGARRLSLSAQKAPLRGVDGVDGDVVESLASAAIHADASMILHLREVNVAREAEVQRLRSVLAAKDREICSLYMQLSTKKTVVDELAGRLAQTLQARGGDVALDVDLFLLESAVAKQQSVDELTAALGVMEREVETLEARVETLESENYRLTVTHEDAASTLESANAELLRVSAENELMESSLKEKQTRIRNLMLYLEEKEEQIMRLKDATEQQLGLAPLGAGTAYASFSDNARAY